MSSLAGALIFLGALAPAAAAAGASISIAAAAALAEEDEDDDDAAAMNTVADRAVCAKRVTNDRANDWLCALSSPLEPSSG
jgi:hypothetical protein